MSNRGVADVFNDMTKVKIGPGHPCEYVPLRRKQSTVSKIVSASTEHLVIIEGSNYIRHNPYDPMQKGSNSIPAYVVEAYKARGLDLYEPTFLRNFFVFGFFGDYGDDIEHIALVIHRDYVVTLTQPVIVKEENHDS